MALPYAIGDALPSTITHWVCYFIVTLACVFALYALQNNTHHYSTIAKWAVVEASHLPDYFKQLSNASVLEHLKDVNSIPGTTGPGIPVAIRLMLSTKYGGVNSSATRSYGAAPGMSAI